MAVCERERTRVPDQEPFDVLILGAGSGGYACALRAASGQSGSGKRQSGAGEDERRSGQSEEVKRRWLQ